MERCYRRLPLEGLLNARDLGGYPTSDGRITKFRALVRSEAPQKLTEKDIAFLKDYGIKMSIDFRGDREVDRQPSVLRDAEGLNYIRCPTFNEQVAFTTRKPGKRPAVTSFVEWGEKYVEMAEGCKDWVGCTLGYIAGSEGGVLYNCTTGKDRTGLISALILGLCGVSYDDITADYCVSEVYLTPVYKELIRIFLEHWPNEKVSIDDPFFRTNPKNMEGLLRHFDNKYGGVAGYVKASGVTDDVIEAIRRKLVL
jgi:protein-tyrosine phosphatase